MCIHFGIDVNIDGGLVEFVIRIASALANTSFSSFAHIYFIRVIQNIICTKHGMMSGSVMSICIFPLTVYDN